jgi:hypothetical protein
MPRSVLRADLVVDGFEGWMTREELRAERFSSIPRLAGTDLVYRPGADPPAFGTVGSGGDW